MDRDPFDLPMKQQAIMLGIALLGGLVSWYAKVKAGTVASASVTQLVGELATSAFAGLLTFWVCIGLGVPASLTPVFVGIGGHAGARAIAALEAWLQRKVDVLNGDDRP